MSISYFSSSLFNTSSKARLLFSNAWKSTTLVFIPLEIALAIPAAFGVEDKTSLTRPGCDPFISSIKLIILLPPPEIRIAMFKTEYYPNSGYPFQTLQCQCAQTVHLGVLILFPVHLTAFLRQLKPSQYHN